MGRDDRGRGARRLRLPATAARRRAHRRHPRHRHGRRAALPDQPAHRLPRVRARTRQRQRILAGCRARSATRSCGTGTSASTRCSRRSPRTRCRANCPTCVTGRIANVLNLRGPNFITDAACASSFAAIDACVDLLVEHHCDAVLTRRRRPQHGRVDLREVLQDRRAQRHRHAARSPTAPTASSWARAAAAFLLKRLADAEARRRSHLRGDSRHRRVERRQGQGHHRAEPGGPGPRDAARVGRTPGWTPRPPLCVEAHGTSTKVGDVVEGREPGAGLRRRRRAARSRSARPRATSATSRPARVRRACSRPSWRCTTESCRRR